MKKVIMIAALVLLISTLGLADTIVVDWNGGGDYTTIQAGINAASDGDTVLVKNGTYTGTNNRNLSWDGSTKHLVVTSENGPDSCKIDCQNNNAMGFYLHDDQDENDRIIGFTIKNCGYYAGIYCASTSPIIYNNIIDNCTRGIYVSDTSEATITYNEISHCDVNGDGGGIYCSAPGLIAYNTIDSCDTYGDYSRGGGIYVNDSDMIVRNNTISHCNSFFGGGIYGGQSYICLNEITYCTVDDYGCGGGGIYAGDAVEGNEIYHCSAFEDDWGGGYGGAIAACDSIISNVLKHNYSENGGTITVWDYTEVTIKLNTIDSNSVYCQAPTYPMATGISCYNCGNITILDNTISNGQSESSDDIGIHLENIDDICKIQGNLIYGNYGTGIIAEGSYGENAEIDIINCTIIENGGHGIDVDDYFSDIEITNCIVYDNYGNGIRNDSGTTPDITFSDVDENGTDYYGCSAGDDCISTDPLFSGTTYSLAWNDTLFSPCIDTGDPELDWDDDDTPPDMGAKTAVTHDYFRDDYDEYSFDNVDWISFPVLNRTTDGWMDALDVLERQYLIDDDFSYNDDILYRVVYQNNGEIYFDNVWQNDLGDFDSKQGYKIELKEQYDSVAVQGISGTWLDQDTPVTLYANQENWVGCFLEEPEYFEDAFESIEDEWLTISSEHWYQDRQSRIPRTRTANPGELYIITVDTLCQLVWKEDTGGGTTKAFVKEKTDYFSYTETIDYMAIDIDTVYSDTSVAEIAAYRNNECLGATKVYDDEYPVQILAYTPQEIKGGGDLEFRIYYGGLKGAGIKTVPYFSYSNDTQAFSSQALYYEKKGFAQVQLITDNSHAPNNKLTLLQNYPNPVRKNMTTIKFMPQQDAKHTELNIYNIRGQLVKTIDCDGIISSGTKDVYYSISWDCKDKHGKEVNNGIYFYKITSGNKNAVQKMLLMK